MVNILSVLISITTILIFRGAYYEPQRLPMPISMQNQPVSFIGNKDVIFTDDSTAHYINHLKNIAINGGWGKGNSLIDLTGGSPGAAIILGGHAPVTPWLIGGYPNSGKFAYMALSLAPKETLKSAWILISPNGQRKIDLSVLEKLKVQFPENYLKVGEVTSGHRNEVQILWKPR